MSTIQRDILPLLNALIRGTADSLRYRRTKIHDEEDVILLRKRGAHAGLRSKGEWYIYCDGVKIPKTAFGRLSKEAPEAEDASSDNELYAFLSWDAGLRLLAGNSPYGARKRRAVTDAMRANASRLRGTQR